MWYSSAWIVGYAGVNLDAPRAHAPPVSTRGPWLTLNPPEWFKTTEGDRLVRQEIDIKCQEEPRRLPRTVEPHLNQIADMLSFRTLKPVRVHTGPFTTAPPGTSTGKHETISFGKVTMRYGPPELTPYEMLASTTAFRPSCNPESYEMRERGLRWLRRSLLTDDPFMAFSALAFGLEAAINCVSDATDGGSVSARMRTFALTVPQVNESNWRRTGKLRNALFHGGITETIDSTQHVRSAIPLARLVLVAALRRALDVPMNDPPQLPVLRGSLIDVAMASDGIHRTIPPTLL